MQEAPGFDGLNRVDLGQADRYAANSFVKLASLKASSADNYGRLTIDSPFPEHAASFQGLAEWIDQ